MIELTFGKSMYGGWYAQTTYGNLEEGGLYVTKSTLKELKAWALENNAILKNRFDNI